MFANKHAGLVKWAGNLSEGGSHKQKRSRDKRVLTRGALTLHLQKLHNLGPMSNAHIQMQVALGIRGRHQQWVQSN